MLRALACFLAAVFALTAQAPAPTSSPAPSDWATLSNSYPDLGFHVGCIADPSVTSGDNLKELVYFKNDSDQAYELDAGFSPDGTTSKIVYYHLRIDPSSVAVTFFGFSRACGSDKTIYWANVVAEKPYLTPQATPSKSAVWLACSVTSHSMSASNGASMIVPLGKDDATIFAYDERSVSLLAYDPKTRSTSDTGATFLKDDVTWFYATAYKYDLNRKTLAFTRSASYKEESNLVTPVDTTVDDAESGQCQKVPAPPQ